jgi:hypothetical protein
MTTKLNERAYAHARKLIEQGRAAHDERDAWSEHQPTAKAENRFVAAHGYGEYAKWYLGIDDAHKPETKQHYKFPYGDFNKAHRCGILAVESRAGQYKHHDIELAAAHLHGMLDAPPSVRAR